MLIRASVVTTGRKPYPHEISATKYASTQLEADTEDGIEEERPYISSIDEGLLESPRLDISDTVSFLPLQGLWPRNDASDVELVNDYFVATATGRPNDVS